MIASTAGFTFVQSEIVAAAAPHEHRLYGSKTKSQTVASLIPRLHDQANIEHVDPFNLYGSK